MFDFIGNFLFSFLFCKKFRTNDVRLNHTSNKMAEFYFTLYHDVNHLFFSCGCSLTRAHSLHISQHTPWPYKQINGIFSALPTWPGYATKLIDECECECACEHRHTNDEMRQMNDARAILMLATPRQYKFSKALCDGITKRTKNQFKRLFTFKFYCFSFGHASNDLLISWIKNWNCNKFQIDLSHKMMKFTCIYF